MADNSIATMLMTDRRHDIPCIQTEITSIDRNYLSFKGFDDTCGLKHVICSAVKATTGGYLSTSGITVSTVLAGKPECEMEMTAAIAVSMLVVMGVIPADPDTFRDTAILGIVRLDGTLNGYLIDNGYLKFLEEVGYSVVIIPNDTPIKDTDFPKLTIVRVNTLKDIVDYAVTQRPPLFE